MTGGRHPRWAAPEAWASSVGDHGGVGGLGGVGALGGRPWRRGRLMRCGHPRWSVMEARAAPKAYAALTVGHGGGWPQAGGR
jgi:hypothetical protein